MEQLNVLKGILGEALPGCDVSEWNEQTGLLGVLPEFDSMAVVTVITLIEEHCMVSVDDSDISGDDFVSVGSLLEWMKAVAP